MRKLVSVVAVLSVVSALAACGKSDNKKQEPAKAGSTAKQVNTVVSSVQADAAAVKADLEAKDDNGVATKSNEEVCGSVRKLLVDGTELGANAQGSAEHKALAAKIVLANGFCTDLATRSADDVAKDNRLGLYTLVGEIEESAKGLLSSSALTGAPGNGDGSKKNPEQKPTSKPTSLPTQAPISKPTSKPTSLPTQSPISKPTAIPTQKPTSKPTVVPTQAPISKPTSLPTQKPTSKPTVVPTQAPTSKPTAVPTQKPTSKPTVVPTQAPTSKPASQPTQS